MKKLKTVGILLLFSFTSYASETNACFDALDANNDSDIDGIEYQAIEGTPPSFASVDASGNGLICFDEFDLRFECVEE